MWTDMHTLPVTNPLRRSTAQIRKFRRYHRSPLYQVADALKRTEMETLETINPFTLAPWEERVQGEGQDLPETQADTGGVMQIAVSSSARNEVVGFGVAIEKRPPRYRKPRLKTFSVTLGARTELNPHSGELAAMAHALSTLRGLKRYRVTLLTSNKAAALTLKNPRQRSGQENLYQIYKLIQRLRRNENRIDIRWVPTSEKNQLLGLAKDQARAATQEDTTPQAQVPRMKSTTLSIVRSQVAASQPVFGGTFQIINHNDQCFVYSTENFDCTGISEPFAPLDGISCSHLNTDNKGIHPSSSSVKAMLCGSSHNSTWVEVHRSGPISFRNEKGDEASCKVVDTLVKGSLCIFSNKARSSTQNIKSQLTSSSTTTIHVSVTAPSAAPAVSSESSSSSHITDC